MIQMFKSFIKSRIQRSISRFGYRIVPAQRDCLSAMNLLKSCDFKTVIDVGANKGETIKQWLKAFPNAHIHGFEPQPGLASDLKAIQAQNPKRVTIWEIAASDQVGQLPFQIHVAHPSSSSLLERTMLSAKELPFTALEQTIYVPTSTLDISLYNEGKLAEPVFIKLDVQGAEMSVLRGAKEVIAQAQYILCEINLMQMYEGQATFTEILNYLEDHGFSLCGVVEQFSLSNGRPVYFDALFEKRTERWVNE